MIRTNIRIYSYQKSNTNEYPNIFVSEKWYEYDTNEYSYRKIFECMNTFEYFPIRIFVHIIFVSFFYTNIFIYSFLCFFNTNIFVYSFVSFFYTNIFGYSFVWSLILEYICVKRQYLQIFGGLNMMGVSRPSLIFSVVLYVDGWIVWLNGSQGEVNVGSNRSCFKA